LLEHPAVAKTAQIGDQSLHRFPKQEFKETVKAEKIISGPPSKVPPLSQIHANDRK
jgi:hypothetical protein